MQTYGKVSLELDLVGASLRWQGRGPTVCALSAFDMAIWDLKSKRAKAPLWRMVGGL